MHLRGVATPMISANKPYHHKIVGETLVTLHVKYRGTCVLWPTIIASSLNI